MSTPTLLRPTDLKEVRDAVLDSAGTLAVTGAGTATAWAGSLDPVDAVLDLGGLTGVITHNPGDMTVSVRAGTPLRDLNAEIGAHGQHVALDAARIDDGATVGGLVSTGDAGPDALTHGTMRDLVIGATLVLADGTVARSGGHVIKNVAGFDLAKLVHGAYGTVAVIAEVVLRLHPRPPATATLVLPCTLDDAAGHARRVLDSQFEASALEWLSDPGVLLVRAVGTEAALPARVEKLAGILGPAASTDERHLRPTPSHDGPARPRPTGAEPEGSRAWAEHARLVRGTADDAVLRLGVPPSRLVEVLDALPARAVTAGLGTGVATVALPPDPDVVAAAHAAVHAAGGTSVLRDRPAGSTAPAWGPPPSALAVLRAVKSNFDPAGRLGPGRFTPWF